MSSASANAGVWPFSGRKASKAAEQPKDTAVKPSAYQKFVKKKGLKKESAFVNLYTDGKDVWLEMPDSIIGRKVLITTILKDSSDPWIEVGQKVSPNRTLEVSRTDSLLVLTEPVRLPESADSLERATLRAATTPAIRYTFPIMMPNGDTTAVLVKATKLFDPANKDVVDMKAVLYGEGQGFMDGTLKSELSGKSSPVSIGQEHIGITRELTFEGPRGNYGRGSLSADGYGRKLRVTGTYETLLSLVPDREIAVRKADSRVGVRKQAFKSFSSEKGVKTEYDALRWNIVPGDHITFYIDTLFPASRRAAIRRGLEAWNDGFRQAGLGDVIKAVPYPRDSTFVADNPFICKVVSTRCNIDLLNYGVVGSGITGGLLGATITVPEGYFAQTWRQYLYSISEADPRFRTLNPGEDALCEILQAAIMRQAGFVLGLSKNLAGSAAYSPEQVRDPEFLANHAFTASVMDAGTMYNTLARPGDRRRGVPTIVDKIGTYDRYAIEWLYRDFPSGEELKQFVDARVGDPEYFYLPLEVNLATVRDVRVRPDDLGNDPMEEYRCRMSTAKYVASHLRSWLDESGWDDSSEQKSLVYECMWLAFGDAAKLLGSRLGGVYAHPLGAGAKYTAVPKQVQKEYIKTIFDTWRNIDWMEADRELLHIAGPYRTAKDITNANMDGQSYARFRLPNVFFAWKDAASGYSPDEYLNDVEAEMFRSVRQGRLEPQEETSLGMYIMLGLINSSPVLKSNYERNANPMNTLAEEVYAPLEGVPTAYLEERDILCRQHLEKVLSVLRSGRSRASDINVRGRIDFLIRIAETALDSDNH